MPSSSSLNVLMVNVLVGLCKPDRKWPNTLRDLGFDVKWLEQPIKSATGNEMRPDLVLTSNALDYCLIFENKTGGISSGSGQFDNYNSLTVSDVQTGMFTKTTVFDVVVACLDSNELTVSRSLSDGNYAFPLLAIRQDMIKQILNSCRITPVNKVFDDGISIDLDKAPSAYMRFDDKSALAEIAPHVITTLVAQARRNNTHLSTEEITKQSFGPLWDVYMHQQAKTTMRRQVRTILQDAADNELSDYLTYEHTNGDSYWQVSFDNTSNDDYPARRLGGLITKSTEFLNRLRKEATQMSLPLFDD